MTRLFKEILNQMMPEEWSKSALALIFMNKSDVQGSNNYRGIKLINHTIKIWERVV